MSEALKGIKVIDLSSRQPGPYCSAILANFGADVICVRGRQFESENRNDMLYWNKRNIVLNLKIKEGKEIFYLLIRKADVMIEQFRPGVVKALEIDYQSLQKINPQLIYCSISGYGQNGPYRNKVGHDVNYLGFSGALSLIGEKDRIPRIPGMQIADLASGGMNATIGILIALIERGHSGLGQYIDISMTDGMIGMLTLPLYQYFKSGKIPERSNTTFSHRYAFYNVYETSDNKYICIGALEAKFWEKLCNHLGVPQYCDHQYDDDRSEEIVSFMREAFKKKTRAEWTTEFAELEVCFAPVLNLDEVVKNPHFLERGMIMKIAGKNNEEIPVVGMPIKLSRTPASYRNEPEGFESSTHNILKELGYSEDEINSLSQKGVI